jgi:Ca-activated chloride channel family protein
MQFGDSQYGLSKLVHSTLILSFLSACCMCQEGPAVNIVPRPRANESARRPASMRLDVKMVLVPANVTDQNDKPVLTLHKEDFHLFEDSVEQKIESFFMDQGPVSLGIVFDASGSMRNKIDKSFAAVDQFLKASLPGDEFSLVEFSDVPTLRLPFTREPNEILDNLRMVQPQGWTAMLDAICLAANQMKSAKNARKALLILSDGGDNMSRYSEGEVINRLREADVRVFAIGLFDRARFLKKAAADTGGGMVVVHHLSELPDAVDKLSFQLRSQYVLGYYPAQGFHDGKFHTLKVLLSQATERIKLHTAWRHGYYAPD